MLMAFQVNSSDIKLAGLGGLVYIYRFLAFRIGKATPDTSCSLSPAGYTIAEL